MIWKSIFGTDLRSFIFNFNEKMREYFNLLKPIGETNTYYIDMLGSLMTNRAESPSSNIVANTAEGTMTYKQTCTLSDYIVIDVQLNHNWKIGSSILPHLHWFQSSATMPNLLIQYRWQVQKSAKTTAWTNLKYTSNAVSYSSGTINQLTAFGSITPPATAGLSDIIQFRLIRDTANTSTLFGGVDGLAASIETLMFDVHYQIDSYGSTQEYVK